MQPFHTFVRNIDIGRILYSICLEMEMHEVLQAAVLLTIHNWDYTASDTSLYLESGGPAVRQQERYYDSSPPTCGCKVPSLNAAALEYELS